MIEKTKTATFVMVAKTLTGLEEVLAGELEKLGAIDIRLMRRSVEFSGDKKLMYKANLWCRTATRILKPIKKLKASSAQELYNNASRVEWLDYMNSDDTFSVDAVINNSSFSNSLFVAQKTKDAIVDWFRREEGKRPSVDIKNPKVRISIYIYKNDAVLAVDSSGETLSHRGYRKETGKAPLGESLAAGIVMLSGWDSKSSFIDSMCGSGTLAIEAGLIAKNIAPGMNRKYFSFMNWKDFDKSLWEDLLQNAKSNIRSVIPCEIIASDIDSPMIREARSNIEQAGLNNDIMTECQSFYDKKPPSPPATLIINPPYGERMPVKKINEFYGQIGDTLKKKYEGYDAFILTSNMEAVKHIGLRATRRIKLFNGPLECRLLKYEIYKGSKKKKKQAQ